MDIAFAHNEVVDNKLEAEEAVDKYLEAIQ